jgi:hypothetical protein
MTKFHNYGKCKVEISLKILEDSFPSHKCVGCLLHDVSIRFLNTSEVKHDFLEFQVGVADGNIIFQYKFKYIVYVWFLGSFN